MCFARTTQTSGPPVCAITPPVHEVSSPVSKVTGKSNLTSSAEATSSQASGRNRGETYAQCAGFVVVSSTHESSHVELLAICPSPPQASSTPAAQDEVIGAQVLHCFASALHPKPHVSDSTPLLVELQERAVAPSSIQPRNSPASHGHASPLVQRPSGPQLWPDGQSVSLAHTTLHVSGSELLQPIANRATTPTANLIYARHSLHRVHRDGS
jgi:hypothetical protein